MGYNIKRNYVNYVIDRLAKEKKNNTLIEYYKCVSAVLYSDYKFSFEFN